MPSAGKSGGQDPAGRALRALERGATALGVQVTRSVNDWRRRQAASRAPRPAPEVAVAMPAAGERDVSDIEVRDLRAELASELERLAEADIRASRGSPHTRG
jgi:hypothetical protein